jgi:hypothetical protein
MEKIMKKLFASVATLLVFLTFQASADDFKVIDLGFLKMRNSNAPWMQIINNQTDWEDFYETLLENNEIGRLDYCGIGPVDEDYCVEPPSIPVVDFVSNQVIVGGVGWRPSGDRLLVSSVQTIHGIVRDERLINVIDVMLSDPGEITVGLEIYEDTMVAIEIAKSDLPLIANLENALIKYD